MINLEELYIDKDQFDRNNLIKFYLHLLSGISNASQSKSILEIGTGVFRSSQAFLNTLEKTNGKLYSCDVDHKEFNHPNIVLIQSNSNDLAKTWTTEIDVLFIDGDHSYEQTKKDFLNFRSFVKPGGFIIFHDIISCEGVGLLWKQIKNNNNSCIEFLNYPGLGVLQKQYARHRNKTVDIIIASYNRPKLIKEAITSVLCQTYQNWKLWIMDDNSNKETVDAICSFKDPRIEIVLHPDITIKDKQNACRYSVLINEALRLSNGEYISYLCDDDRQFPDWLKSAVSWFENNPDKDVVFGKLTYCDINKRKYPPEETLEPRFFNEILTVPGGKLDHNQVIHKRECLFNSGLWNEHPGVWTGADSYFFNQLASHYPFYPLDVYAAEKGEHDRQVQKIKEKAYEDNNLSNDL